MRETEVTGNLMRMSKGRNGLGKRNVMHKVLRRSYQKGVPSILVLSEDGLWNVVDGP